MPRTATIQFKKSEKSDLLLDFPGLVSNYFLL